MPVRKTRRGRPKKMDSSSGVTTTAATTTNGRASPVPCSSKSLLVPLRTASPIRIISSPAKTLGSPELERSLVTGEQLLKTVPVKNGFGLRPEVIDISDAKDDDAWKEERANEIEIVHVDSDGDDAGSESAMDVAGGGDGDDAGSESAMDVEGGGDGDADIPVPSPEPKAPVQILVDVEEIDPIQVSPTHELDYNDPRIKPCRIFIVPIKLQAKEYLGLINDTDSEGEDEDDDGAIEEAAAPVPETNGANSSATAEGTWEIESILDYKDGLYYVKWKDWTSEHNTWEPVENLHCPELLTKFYVTRKEMVLKITAQRKALEGANGPKRFKGLSLRGLALPPDPRPLKVRAQEFYQKTRVPTPKEIKDLEAQWRLTIQNLAIQKEKVTLVRWNDKKFNKSLEDGLKNKLMEKAEDELRRQIILCLLDQKREKALKSLKIWEGEINEITGGKPKITIENNVDAEGRPPGFRYSNDYIPGPGVTIPDDPIVGCGCIGCFDERKTCCPRQFGQELAYTAKTKRLKADAGKAIYECNRRCACGPECPNRVVQDGQVSLTNMELCIFRTYNSCGWGVKTMRKIPKGTFVTLYTGEVIKAEDAEARGREYRERGTNGASYLFDLDFNDKDAIYTVDAFEIGNVAHFINHSCEPNLSVYSVWVDCVDPDLPKLALFAEVDIPKNAQLTFDYHHISPGTNPPEEGTAETTGPTSSKTRECIPITCLCGATNCRGTLLR